jgi:hypothetical protein
MPIAQGKTAAISRDEISIQIEMRDRSEEDLASAVLCGEDSGRLFICEVSQVVA